MLYDNDILFYEECMIKVLFLTILFYIGYRFLTKSIRKAPYSMQSTQSSSPYREGEMVRDPICNTYIVKNASYSVQRNDSTHYFCSLECKDNFLKNQ